MPKEKIDPFSNALFQDPYQEGILLTALVHAPECISEVMKIIPIADVFQYQHNRVIYEAICEIYLEKNDVDEMTLRIHMSRSGKNVSLEKAGLTFKFDAMIPSDQEEISAAAEGLVSMYRRQLAYKLTLRLNANLEKDISDEDLAQQVSGLLDALTLQGGKSAEKTSKMAADGAMKDIDRAYNLHKEGKISGVPTGFDKLDREIGGWQKDEMIILAGRPGMMKTGMSLHSLYHAAKNDRPVGFFSMEMTSERLNFRLAAMETGIPYSRMIRGHISLEEYARIQSALDNIGKMPIYYYDDVAIKNVDKMRVVAAEWLRKYSIEAAFIDYLQYCQTSDKMGGNREAQVSAVSKAIKGINLQLQIPIIALAQLSRATEGRKDPTPILSDLRESGQIEADAGTVIGLFNPEYYVKDMGVMIDPMTGVPYPDRSYYMNILKNRSGSTMRVQVFADPATNRFYDTDMFNQTDVIPIPFEQPRQPDNNVFAKAGVVFDKYADPDEIPF